MRGKYSNTTASECKFPYSVCQVYVKAIKHCLCVTYSLIIHYYSRKIIRNTLVY